MAASGTLGGQSTHTCMTMSGEEAGTIAHEGWPNSLTGVQDPSRCCMISTSLVPKPTPQKQGGGGGGWREVGERAWEQG